jgi:hypothetical protein
MSQSPITRAELYELVWTTPMCHLAKEYGVSSYRLTRICDDHEIPRPGNDYWPLLRLNLDVERTPLPPSPASLAEPIIIETNPRSKKPVADPMVATSSHAPIGQTQEQE